MKNLQNETAAPRPTRPSGPANREDERAGFLLVDVCMPNARLRRVGGPHSVPIRRCHAGGEVCSKIRRRAPRRDRRLRRAHGPTGGSAVPTQRGVLHRARVNDGGTRIARVRLEQLLGDGSRQIRPHKWQDRDRIIKLLLNGGPHAPRPVR